MHMEVLSTDLSQATNFYPHCDFRPVFSPTVQKLASSSVMIEPQFMRKL